MNEHASNAQPEIKLGEYMNRYDLRAKAHQREVTSSFDSYMKREAGNDAPREEESIYATTQDMDLSLLTESTTQFVYGDHSLRSTVKVVKRDHSVKSLPDETGNDRPSLN